MSEPLTYRECAADTIIRLRLALKATPPAARVGMVENMPVDDVLAQLDQVDVFDILQAKECAA